MNLCEDSLQLLKSTLWFSALGDWEGHPEPVGVSLHRLRDGSALDNWWDAGWDDLSTRQFGNELWIALDRLTPQNLSLVANRVDKAADAALEVVYRRIERAGDREGLDQWIVNWVKGVALVALEAATFARAGYRVASRYDDLLAVLAAGHLPCGWRGQYPDGELVAL